MASDRLALAHAIEEAGIERSKAERVASAIFDAGAKIKVCWLLDQAFRTVAGWGLVR